MAQIRTRKVKTLRNRTGLISFAHDNTSQGGEDGIIQEIFRRLPPTSSSTNSKRWCVDVGAWDGKHLSNTYTLLINNATIWNGILIEADPSRTQELQDLHGPLNNICLTELVSCLSNSSSSLTSLLQNIALSSTSTFTNDSFDFISIDVDGTDYWLMYDVLQSFTPKVICCEFNPSIPQDVIYIQPRDDKIRHGSSLAALVELANSNGYTLIETTVFNAFFVPNEMYEKYFQDLVPCTDLEVLHEVTMGTRMYQLYNGSLKLSGCKKLLWHRIGIKDEHLIGLSDSILKSKKRWFPFSPSSNESTNQPYTKETMRENDKNNEKKNEKNNEKNGRNTKEMGQGVSGVDVGDVVVENEMGGVDGDAGADTGETKTNGERPRVKDKKEHLPLAEYRRRKRAEKNAIKAKERYIQEQ